ncbi:MAG: Hsp20/alpha crystallin family protein [Desulfobulbaceae bacterium]|nr:Hsp20/alpha crystallin family protein [Desulfobulbaceae bacterium]
MDLVSRRPFGEVSSLRKEMDKLWNHFLGETPFPGFVSQEWLPSVDVSETKDKLLIKAELPGLDAKDVSVNISGDLLTIKGEKKQEEEKKDEQYYRSERFYGSFQRSIRLPVNIKTNDVDATFKKGVLQIALPKTEEARKKEIKIKVK